MLNIDDRLIKEISPKIKPNALSVLLAIAIHLSRKNGTCFPSHDRLMMLTGLGRDAVYVALKVLKDNGLLVTNQAIDSKNKKFGQRTFKVSTKFIKIFIDADEAEPLTENPYTDDPEAERPYTENQETQQLNESSNELTIKEQINEGGREREAKKTPTPTTFDEMMERVNEQAEQLKALKPITKPTHIVTTVEAVELPELPKFYQPTNPGAAAKLLSRLEVKPKASTVKEAHEQIAAWCAENSATVQWCYEAARRKQTADDLHARIVDFVGCYSNHETVGKQLNFFNDPAYVFSKGLTKWLQTQNKFDREQGAKAQKAPFQQPEQKYTPPQKPTPPQAYYD